MEWPGGEPETDTTGSVEGFGQLPTQKSLTTKAFIHTVKVTTAYRLFSEIEEGMLIVDLVTAFVKITDPGSSDLLEGQVIDTNEFQSHKREVAEGGGQQPTAVPLNVTTLKNPSIVIDGQRYLQKEVGDRLAKVWDSVFAGYKMSQTLLLKRAA